MLLNVQMYFHMVLEVPAGFEGRRAFIAHERPFSGVDSHVGL